MPISLRGSNGAAVDAWPLGETRRIFSNRDIIDIGGGGKALRRNVVRSFTRADYPALFELLGDTSNISDAYFASRAIPTGDYPVALGDDGAGTILITQANGAIYRTTDYGTTAEKIFITAKGGKPAFGNGVWIIPNGYNSNINSFLRSTDGGVTWTTISIDVATVANAQIVNNKSIVFTGGRFIIVLSNGYIAHSTDGLSWTAVKATTRLTTPNIMLGNGLCVLFDSSGRVDFSSDGGLTWTAGANRNCKNQGDHLVWTGKYWLSGGTAFYDGAPVSIDQPAPTISGSYIAWATNLTDTPSYLTWNAASRSQSGNYWIPSGPYFEPLVGLENGVLVQENASGHSYAIRLVTNADLDAKFAGNFSAYNPEATNVYGDAAITDHGLQYVIPGNSATYYLATDEREIMSVSAMTASAAWHDQEASWYIRVK